jgi:hypothetical protein
VVGGGPERDTGRGRSAAGTCAAALCAARAAARGPPDLLSDGTERRRQRPQTPATQAAYSRGKQKTPGDKKGGLGQAKTTRVGGLRQP